MVFSHLYSSALDRELGTDDSTRLSVYVLPSDAMHDVPDCGLLDAKVACQLMLAESIPVLDANAANDVVVQHRTVVLGATSSPLQWRHDALGDRVAHVVSVGAEKQMARIYAPLVIAAVTNLIMAIQHGICVLIEQPRDSMRSKIAAPSTAEREQSVAIVGEGAIPVPAIGFIGWIVFGVETPDVIDPELIAA